MIEFIIILGLIILNGLFSMAEIALLSAKKTKLEIQASKGDSDAKRALNLALNPDQFLSTVQIGITLIGILTGVFSGAKIKGSIEEWLGTISWMQGFAGPTATTIVVVIITYLSLVLGELLPKRIGLSNAENIAKSVAGPMKWISRITYPFVILLSISTGFLSRLLRIQPADNQVTEEEIKAIIHEGTEQGTIEEAEQEIIQRVFHLGDRNITSLMTHRSEIVWMHHDITVGEMKQEMEEPYHSFYPICDGKIDDIKGIVAVKDILLEPNEKPIIELVRPAVYVPENNTAYQVLEKFKSSKIHHCFIVDEYGSIEGLITLNDILEAIVGDIPQPDEVDHEIIKRADGSFLIDAQIPFYDFLSHFEKTDLLEEGEQEFDTLAGFILEHLQKIPSTGDHFQWEGVQFEIIDMDNQRIDKILVTVPSNWEESV
jgi:putative hemolysin